MPGWWPLNPEAEATFVWEDDEYLAEAASPVAYNGLLYVATSYGVLVCYDAKTGEKQWEKEFNNGFYSSPMIADGKLYIIDMRGVTHILKADRTGTIIGCSRSWVKGDMHSRYLPMG